ncbi:hypothetical protein CCAX7_002460 [Capsulimonas corticalis]|uniref:Uncharacterized protein n=1 Tax=Capsulimonas corticalis TaxID=2219043 RepID=A0A402CRQ9_9BACT|nr:outer membrane beta-barrel protein [Capsulimonas corticalis]BDI28195.1 hypothetical protein CCAX7_002460 [Capsulimonas corticalis]
MRMHRFTTEATFRGLATIAILAASAPIAHAQAAGAPTETTPNPTPPAPAATEPPAPPKQTPAEVSPNAITVSGLIDFYYQYQFSSPTKGQKLTGRIYDFRHNTPTLSLAWVDVKKAAQPGGFGFTASLATGDSADADVANPYSNQGEARFKNIAQLFATYTDKSGFTADFGKFLSPYGYDTTKVILNPNYSLTDATFLVPNYEAGLRMTYPVKAINTAFSLFVVNSLYHTATSGVQEDNGTKDFIVRANYTTPDGKFNYIPAYGFGKDKLGVGNENVVLFDNWLTYHLTAADTLAGEYVYRKDTNKGGNYDLTGHGYGAYYRRQLDPKNAVIFRVSGFQKKVKSFFTLQDTIAGGLQDLAVVPSVTGTSESSVQTNEVTATYEIKVTPALTTRIEYRHDSSSNGSVFGYVNGDSASPTDKQDTITVAGLLTF